MKIGLPRAAIYRVCQCIETRKTSEIKAKSGRGAVQMTEKKRNQLVKTIWDKKVVTSMKLAEKMNAERSLVDRIVREAAVKTYTSIRHPEFRPELEQRPRQKMDCGKEKSRNAHFEPYRRREGPSCCPVTSSYRGNLGCPQAGGWQRRLGSENEQGLRRRIRKCLMILAEMSSEPWFQRRRPTWGWLRTPSS